MARPYSSSIGRLAPLSIKVTGYLPPPKLPLGLKEHPENAKVHI